MFEKYPVYRTLYSKESFKERKTTVIVILSITLVKTCFSFCYQTEALKGMEAVAEHINEMQKIYDEYGSVFDELTKSYKEANPHKQVSRQLYGRSISTSSC